MPKNLPDRGYCNDYFSYSRWKTCVVKAGDLAIGGDYPIRVQSMTTTDTMDTKGTVAQSIRMIEAGSELVRITAPSKNEANNLRLIKEEIRRAGYATPLIADIHFTPNAAEIAARLVEKVRVNPGNYVDKKKFQFIEYTDDAYQAELERIAGRFSPLVKICKEYGTAMRIGTNHGSLSDRIMSRYGDTPEGMVESAMEFVRICEQWGYRDLILSMKSSNPLVMIQAYRLLVAEMRATDRNYPLHLGVTEAGEAEDGRIKSALGIGALLEDGIGDTIRVSLTESPEAEIPVAQNLVNRYATDRGLTRVVAIPMDFDPYGYHPEHSQNSGPVGGDQEPVVIASVVNLKNESLIEKFTELGHRYDLARDKWHRSDLAADFIYTGKSLPDFPIPGDFNLLVDAEVWDRSLGSQYFPFVRIEEWDKSKYETTVFLSFSIENAANIDWKEIAEAENIVLIAVLKSTHGFRHYRSLQWQLDNLGIRYPIVFHQVLEENMDKDEHLIHSTIDLGASFLVGRGDGIWVEHKNAREKDLLSLAFGILQAARLRISKTEYISCPSCGRTLFDLQETTAQIRNRTDHLKGLKIGVMGCIVNGPGEMADADFGYVGSGPGKITLYKGQEIIQRNIPSEDALEALIDLIKAEGRWVEPIKKLLNEKVKYS